MRKPIYPAQYEVTLVDGTKKFVCHDHLSRIRGVKTERLPNDSTIDCIECKYDHAND